MRSKKLTYNQLYTLVKDGRYDEIPDGYNIKWFGHEPGKEFEFDIPGENISITKIGVPIPANLHLVSEYVVDFPTSLPSVGAICKKADFGDVYFMTRSELTEMKATYDMKKTSGRELMEWVRQYSEYITGRVIKKADLCFDMKIKLKEPYTYMDIYNVMLKDIDFGFENEEIVTEVVANLICDWFHVVI